MKKNNATFTAPLYVTVVMILLGVSGKLLELTLKKSNEDFFFTAMLLQLFVYMIPAALYCKLRGIDLVKSSGAKLMRPSELPFVISAFLLYIFGMLFLIYIGMTPSQSEEAIPVLQASLKTDSFFVALCYIVIPAIAEEMLFRSVLLKEYADARCRGVWSLILTSVFFSMLHFSFSAFISYLWGGLIFGLITYITRSSLPSVIFHMLSNFATMNYSESISKFLVSAENSIVLIFLMSTLFLLSLYFTAASLQTIYERRAAEYEEGSLAGSRADAVKRLAKAGKVDKNAKNEAGETKSSVKDMLLSPTLFLAIFVFVFITV